MLLFKILSVGYYLCIRFVVITGIKSNLSQTLVRTFLLKIAIKAVLFRMLVIIHFIGIMKFISKSPPLNLWFLRELSTINITALDFISPVFVMNKHVWVLGVLNFIPTKIFSYTALCIKFVLKNTSLLRKLSRFSWLNFISRWILSWFVIFGQLNFHLDIVIKVFRLKLRKSPLFCCLFVLL